jgi:hypothetical protein
MNGWHIAMAIGLCILLGACSRPDALFSRSPVFTAHSGLSVDVVADCVAQRWKQGARTLQRAGSGKAIRLRAESQFSGAIFGVSVAPDGLRTRVDYFERRRTDPLYWSMVRGCLLPNQSGDQSDQPAS